MPSNIDGAKSAPCGEVSTPCLIHAASIMLRRIPFWPFLVVVGVVWLTTTAARVSTVSPTGGDSAVVTASPDRFVAGNAAVVQEVNVSIERLCADANVPIAEPADELAVWRRLSLALHGTIPSLEEIRAFESDTNPSRLERQLDRMLEDPRFADYFAERLARSFVGVDNGQFLIFRRDRFLDWLTRQMQQNRPYDEIVREMISGSGVWTGEGEVNFLTAAFANDEFDASVLTARSVRAFLGQRMDCAQCHDHPFDHWTQRQFHGLAAHFAQVDLSLAGVSDDKEKVHTYEDSQRLDEVEMAPIVPFHPEWLGQSGSRRERLARWMTHPENRRFERAAANRVWALMFGLPFLTHRPVDDIPDPESGSDTAVLDLLGAEFRESGYDLRHLIRVIAATDAFRRSSAFPESLAATSTESPGDADQPHERLARAKACWAVFPLVRLRPEQVIGSMLQANNIRTIDRNSHLFIRFLRFVRENDFVDEFGDPGVEELQERAGTIPQALLRMNGDLSRELTSLNPFFAPGRIAATASSPQTQIETAYLACLTRYPTSVEAEQFADYFSSCEVNEALEDLYWALFNSPEFSWNH